MSEADSAKKGSNRWRIGQKGLWSKLLLSFKETQENLDDTCWSDAADMMPFFLYQMMRR